MIGIANMATADAELLRPQDALQAEAERVLGELDRYLQDRGKPSHKAEPPILLSRVMY